MSKEARGRVLRKNIFSLFAIKGMNVLCSLVLVPLTLDYLTKETYGIWMTISSILLWFSFFDVGLGNGLRNYLTKWLTLGNFSECRKYIATTFALLIGIVTVIATIVLVAVCFVDFNSLLNVYTVSNDELREVVALAVVFTSATFIVKNVGVVFMSLQKYAVNDLLVFFGHVLSLIAIYILKCTTDGKLIYVTFVFSFTPVVVFVIAGLFLFGRYRQLRPTLHDVDFCKSSQLVGKGLSFFVIQLTSCLVIYGSANLFISHFCGSNIVTEYNIAYRYFNVLTIGYTIIIAPLWSAYTSAYVKNDIQWVKRTFYKSIAGCAAFILLGMLMWLADDEVYRIWVRESVTVPSSISSCVFLYTVFFNLNNCVTYLLNGLNTVMIQLITSLVMTAAYLVSVEFIAENFGAEGIILCMTSCYAVFFIIHFIQCRMLLKGKARGIWIK